MALMKNRNTGGAPASLHICPRYDGVARPISGWIKFLGLPVSYDALRRWTNSYGIDKALQAARELCPRKRAELLGKKNVGRSYMSKLKREEDTTPGANYCTPVFKDTPTPIILGIKSIVGFNHE